MMSEQKNETWKCLAGICAVLSSSSDGDDKKCKIIENTLRRNYCINSQIPETPYLASAKREFIGSTVLHLALKQRELRTFNFLISQGADFTLKNSDGETVLHQAFRESYVKRKECDKLWGTIVHPYIDSVLSAHVETQNSSNPSNKNGLTHFHIACMANHAKSVKYFLQNGAFVNQLVNFDSPSLPGYSPLHFAVRYCASETVSILLEYGANVNLFDAKGHSPMHLLIKRKTEIADWLNTGRRMRSRCFEEESRLNESMTSMLLSHLDRGLEWLNYPGFVIDIHRFSLLHVACTMQEGALVDTLLLFSQSPELPIKANSPVFPGYTPAHFAAHFRLKTVKILMDRGDDILHKDANGTTPLEICMKKPDFANYIHEFIASRRAWRDILFSDGKTSLLDFTTVLNGNGLLRDFPNVNMSLPPDSPLWPSYTPLHLLVLFVITSNGGWNLNESSDYRNDVSWRELHMVDTINWCLEREASVTAQDARGYSPIHLAFRMQKIYLVCVLLKAQREICNPVDETGLSHLHIACAVKETNFVEKLLKSRQVDVNSPVPFSFRSCKEKTTFIFAKGSTPLHIAVITRNNELVRILLAHGANYMLKDDDGLTPVHRLLGLNRVDDRSLANVLLSSCKLCFMNDDVVSPAKCGLTYLHVVSYWQNDAAVEKLLDLGADINAAISYKRSDNPDSDRWRCQSIRIKGPIDSLTFLDRYNGYTPLQLAMEENNETIVRILVQRGADVLAKYADGMSPTYAIFTARYSRDQMLALFVNALLRDDTLQSRLLADTGLTMLHVACATSDLNLIKRLCSQGLDVNARAYMNSPIWPGCTPLHVLMIKSKDNISLTVKIINFLLSCGADVMITNADKKTPLHEDFERFLVQGPRFASLLLHAQKDFSINPVSIKGISHFHIACSCKEAAIVEEFLKHGADVHLPIDYFCEFYGGLTPLHLASVHQLKDIFIFLTKRFIDISHAIHYILQIQEDSLFVATAENYRKTVDLLLQYGANPNTPDRTGNTSMHVAAMSKLPLEDVWHSLLRAGAELNVENLLNETLLEILLSSNNMTSQSIEFFLRHGASINTYSVDDGEGFIPIILLRTLNERGKIQQALCKAISNVPDINYFDEMGRSLIHNVVSHSADLLSVQDYTKFIQTFEKLGHYVDHRDEQGRTALHAAIEFRNPKAVLALLACGADVNVLDQSDKAMLVIDEELQNDILPVLEDSSLLKKLCTHVHKLRLCGIYVNGVIQELDTRIRQKFNFDFYEFEASFTSELIDSICMKIEPYSLLFYDFLSETGVVSAYPTLPQIQRHAIRDFFRDNSLMLHERFPQLFEVAQLQLNKAIARSALLESAKIALSILRECVIPDLCSEALLRFLSNEDIKNLIASAEII